MMQNLKTLQPESRQRTSSEKAERISTHGIADARAMHPLLQLQQTIGNQGVLHLLKSSGIQAKLKISEPGDTYEQEADRVAAEIMNTPERHAPTISASNPQIHRKCAGCAEGGSLCPECADEEKAIHRKPIASAAPTANADTAPRSGSELIPAHGAGQPLPDSLRTYFEPRFGRDLGNVRIHTGSHASESAKAINAMAYTVGRDVVVGAPYYQPETQSGKTLIAHELTHVIQQADHKASLPIVQRACISDPECKPATEGALPGTAVKGSATHFNVDVEKEQKELAVKEKRKTPRELRKEHCDKVPPDAACTADGHGKQATAFEELFRPYAPTQMKMAKGVFVDKDIEKDVGAYVWGCSYFTPKIEGDTCIFIPEHLEKDAALYKKGEKTIGGRDRDDWLTVTLSTITHELEHVRFGKEIEKTEPRAEACKFADVSHELSELAAIMSEFAVHYRAYADKPWYERQSRLADWFRFKVTQPQKHGETIAGILKAIRCRCECVDVDAYISRVVKFTTAGWTEDEKNTFHSELRGQEWKLDWPIKTPPPPRDIPSWMLTPSIQLGYGYFGGHGYALGAGLDLGIPLDRLGRWHLLLGAQGRALLGLESEHKQAFLYGLKVGFLSGPALGKPGVQLGLFGEIGGGRFPTSEPRSGLESGSYAGGGGFLRWTADAGRVIPYVGIEVGGGARIDTSKPEVQKWIFSGFTFGAQF